MSARLCLRCGKRPALFIRVQRRPGKKALVIVKSDSDHDVCQQCYRSMRDSQRAA